MFTKTSSKIKSN